MAAVDPPLPSREDELALHQRLVDEDPVAPADLMKAYFAPLIAYLKRLARHPLARQLVEDAASEALFSLAKSPRMFDPCRNNSAFPLFAFLKMAARGDLLNAVDKEKKHWRGRKTFTSVEHSSNAWKYLRCVGDPGEPLQLRECAEKADKDVLARVRVALTPEELNALDLMLQGERKTSVFAKALHVDHLPKLNQKVEVKKVKDKLIKRIKRAKNG
jgi:DNA-directed RNA polymerase specialized sigma24 family protein